MTGCASIGGDYCISSGAVLDTPRLDETRVPEFSKHNVDVMWIRVTRAEMIAAGLRIAGTSELDGFAIPPVDNNKCVVFVVEEQNTNSLSLALGHEVLHCFYGIWHGTPPPFEIDVLNDNNRSRNFRPAALAAAKIGFEKHFQKISRFLSLNDNKATIREIKNGTQKP